MDIKQTIENDFLTAYKARDEQRAQALRMLKSALKNAEIDGKDEFNNDVAIKVLRREGKQREQAAIEFEKGGRLELAEKERYEAGLIASYLPAEITREEIEKVVAEAISNLNPAGIKDMGKVMAYVMQKLGASADGNIVSAVVKENLLKQN
ncbi:MAG: GatB/YqeY domain-containing protein [Candidatus Berkelbacteria bacterium]|nr:GatB/YqeY domain-containing protein [Candidatus Berkelbacteria bacterium]